MTSLDYGTEEVGGCCRKENNLCTSGREAISEIALELEQEQNAEERLDEAIHIDDYTVPEETEAAVAFQPEEEEIFAVLERETDHLSEEAEEEIFSVLEEDAS